MVSYSLAQITTMDAADSASTSTSGLLPKEKKKLILNTATIEDLQKKYGAVKPSFHEVLYKLYQNDLYTEFDKRVLRMKPNDCAIIQKYSKVETFPIDGHDNLKMVTVNTFISDHPLREFHRRSVKKWKDIADTEGLERAQNQLAKIENLPLLVFIHGLGGQLSQFEPIIQEFRNCSDMFGIDLPGFGNSKPTDKTHLFTKLSASSEEDNKKLNQTFIDMRTENYRTDSIVDILYQILLQKFPKRTFIIVAHSMGTHLAIKLVNRLPSNTVESLCFISPPKLSETVGQRPSIPYITKSFLALSSFYPRLFDFYRMIDRFGGLYSHSVNSYLYPAEKDVFKRLTQLRWNLDTNSIVFLKYARAFRPAAATELLGAASKLCHSTDQERPRILICCGDSDKVTPLKYSKEITNILRDSGFAVKLSKVKEANHSVFLDRPHVLSGLVYQFVSELGLNIDCTWTLKIRAIIGGDKWSMKNIEKWKKAVTLSKPLINYASPEKPKSPLLGMKTLRENDATHNPLTFESTHPEIYAIMDIGSDTPSYDPKDFKRIKYIKYKTESKVTPDDITIAKFLDIVDKLVLAKQSNQYIVVHCHYGQNRTGFLICCYLVERLGWTVKEALEAFENSKEPGIKHQHFKNALYLRYGE